MSQPISATDNKGIVLYDGECAFCQKSVSILKKLDWFNRLAFHNGRNLDGVPAHSVHLDQARLIEEMHLLTPDRSQAYAGFKAFRWMAGRLPLLWLIYPFLFIPGIPQLGQKIYLWIARNRFNLV